MVDTLNPLGQIAADMDLSRRQIAARLRDVAPPEAMILELHDIPVATGDTVVDTITGMTGVVLGYGVAQVQTEE